MRPPICSVCGSDGRFKRSGDFRIVNFADYVPPPEDLESAPLRGSDWFCPDHAIAAEQLSREGLTLARALEELGPRDDGKY
jgi:hypothetical protein